MARLPKPGGDDGNWGDILNAFLLVAHETDGTPKDVGIVANKYVLPDGGVPLSDLSQEVQDAITNGGVSDADSDTKGVIQLSGHLTGTAESPQIASGVITNTHIDGSAAIAQSKLALDADLTTFAGLSPANDDILQRKSGAWTNRTIAQVKTDLSLTKADVGLSNVDNTSDTAKNAATATLTNKTINADDNTISNLGTTHFATNVIDTDATLAADSDTRLASQKAVKAYVDANAGETSTASNVGVDGVGVFNQKTGANFEFKNISAGSSQITVTEDSDDNEIVIDASITAADVGLGNVDNTSDADKPISDATQTAIEHIHAEDWLESGASADIDWGIPLLSVTLSQDWIPSLINPPASAETGAQVTVKITMSGSHTITWPPEIQWNEGTAPAPADGEQSIVEILRTSPTQIFGWVVSSSTPITSLAPASVTGLVQHFDAHEDADSIVLQSQASVDAFADALEGFGIANVWRGARADSWTAEVGGNASVSNHPNAFFSSFKGGPAVLTDPDGRRGLVFSGTGSTAASSNGVTFPALGVLTNHTIILVVGPLWAENELGGASGHGTSGIALSNDHETTVLADDWIFGYNHAEHPQSLGVRWQENGSGTTNRTVSDPRDAPAYPDVYATRYNGTTWEFFRHSGRANLDTYTQSNIDLGNNIWGIGAPKSRALPWTGAVHEIAIYNVAVSDDDLIALMDGMVEKWNL